MNGFFDEITAEFIKTFITDNRWKLFLSGFKNTLIISITAVAIGVILGAVIAVLHDAAADLKRKKRRASDSFLKRAGRALLFTLNKLFNAYVAVMRGTPLAIQIMIMAFVIMSGNRNKLLVASIAFGLNSAAYVSEVIRGGINSVDVGQMEAGRSVGLNRLSVMWYIIMPQAIKNILPALCNEFIAVIKETSIVGLIAVTDLTRAGDLVRSRTLSAFFPLISVAVVYFLLVAALTATVSKLEARLAQSDRK